LLAILLFYINYVSITTLNKVFVWFGHTRNWPANCERHSRVVQWRLSEVLEVFKR